MRKTNKKRWKIQRRTQKGRTYEDARAEVNAILDSFEDEMTSLRMRVNELTVENQALKKKHTVSSDRIPVLYMGEEEEFYPGEIKDLVLDALTGSLDNLQLAKRKKDIVLDIIDNNDFQETGNKRAKEIKTVMKGYDRMTAQIKKALKDTGFEITDTKTHYKISYHGDKRYQTSVSKTPSDTRSGKNMAKNIINMAF